MILEVLGIDVPKEETIVQPIKPGPLETALIDLEPMEIPLLETIRSIVNFLCISSLK